VRNQAGGLRFHDLCHSHAAWFVDDGVPVNMVQRVLGHERASTTLISTRAGPTTRHACSRLDDEDDPEDPDDGALVPR
jgi:integrase